MEVVDLRLPGLELIRPRVLSDARGFFFESYRASRYADHGIHDVFVQDNHSHSVRDTLRGLHHQSTPGQAKLIRVARGRIFDVAVDIRPESATFGQWHGIELDAEHHEQLYLPVGFAHGFCVLSDSAEVLYKVSSVYDSATEMTLAYDDPELGIAWPVSAPLVSERDRAGESFRSLRQRLAR
jgi:dTDP-4-dehydrorhamnose 3,5-epimerase